MEQKIYAALQTLYSTRREAPHIIRMKIRLCDKIDFSVLRSAVDKTMQRYPYFCVELQKRNGQYVFAHNTRPVVISSTVNGTELNCETSNYHMLAFSAENDWIVFDAFHGITDGIGAYEVIRTLLYYYCSEKYNVKLSREGIRLSGDDIPDAEWVDPAVSVTGKPVPMQPQMPPALALTDPPVADNDMEKTVYSIDLSESEFMSFVSKNKASPGTMTALMLSHAVVKIHPNAKSPVRIIMCVNQRKALKAPLAHHSLVGFAVLEYTKELQSLPVEQQIARYRKVLHEQTNDDAVLSAVKATNAFISQLIDMPTDKERLDAMAAADEHLGSAMTAVISYVGKAGFGDAEKYIQEFRTLTRCPDKGIIAEISAVNGRFFIDIIQPFSDPLYINGFLQELEQNGIAYDLHDPVKLQLPNIKLPWSE